MTIFKIILKVNKVAVMVKIVKFHHILCDVVAIYVINTSLVVSSAQKKY